MKEKSEEQLEYVCSSINNSIFLKACPGSGKTEVVGLKAAYEFRQWSGLGGIAILTFTNNAADAITDRVCQFSGVDKIGFPHFVGTFDSWLHGYIGHPFIHKSTGYKGKNGDCSLRLVDEKDAPQGNKNSFLHAFKLKTPFPSLTSEGVLKTRPLFANNIRYDGDWEIRSPRSSQNEYISLADFSSTAAFAAYKKDGGRSGKTKEWLTQEYVAKSFSEAKSHFNSQGFVTYHDVERLSAQLLLQDDSLNELLAKRFPLIIVDECQDLSLIQLSILLSLKEKGTRLHFVGDLDQAIYEFKKVDPIEIGEFVTGNAFEQLPLTTNFRSCQEIVNSCQKLIPSKSETSSGADTKLCSPCICVIYPKDRIGELPGWFSSYLEERSLDLGNSAIVTRGWSTVAKLRGSGKSGINGRSMEVATAIGLWQAEEEQLLPEAIDLMGRFVTSAYLSDRPRSSKSHFRPDGVESSVEWRLFLAAILRLCAEDDDVSNLGANWTSWAKTVKEKLPGIILQVSSSLRNAEPDVIAKLGGKIALSSPSGKGGVTVSETLTLGSPNQSGIRITTIHSVKGQTLDSVMVVSSVDKRGTTDGHWEQWLADKTAEAARLAFVASSRASHLLVWAVPDVDDDQRRQIKELGFSFVDLDVSSDEPPHTFTS